MRPGLVRVRNIFNPADPLTGAVACATMVNKGYCERRADWRSGAGGGGFNSFAANGAGANVAPYCKYAYRTSRLSKLLTRTYTAGVRLGFPMRTL